MRVSSFVSHGKQVSGLSNLVILVHDLLPVVLLLGVLVGDGLLGSGRIGAVVLLALLVLVGGGLRRGRGRRAGVPDLVGLHARRQGLVDAGLVVRHGGAEAG
ncbi:hypothetical protein PG990_002762 [Apiospora arundinis]